MILNQFNTVSLALPKTCCSSRQPDHTNHGHLYFKTSSHLSTADIAP
ncbi:MAG: hypothetical protein WCG25_00535 [bacterium]